MRSIALAWTLLAALALQGASLAGAEGASRTLVFRVKGMTCALCAKAIDRSLRTVDGVQNVAIDAKTEQVTVVAAPAIDPKVLEAAIAAVGDYETAFLPER